MISSADASRCPRGFRLANIRPVFDVESPPAYACTYSTPGSCMTMSTNWRHPPVHRLVGGVLVGLDRAVQPPGVLLREEALGHRHVEEDGGRHRGERDRERQRLAPQNRRQGAAVETEEGAEGPLAPARETARRLASGRAEQEGAHHRRRRQRDRHGDQDGDRQRHGKLPEQPSHDAAHEEDRNEDGDQGDADREHREGDLARALGARPRRGEAPFSRCRVMFSITTIASSTTKPVAMVMAIRERLSML